MTAPLEWRAPSHECTRLLIELMSGVGGPAQPHALAATERLRRARDVGGRDQQHGAVVGRDAIERAIALVGCVDDLAGDGVRGVRPLDPEGDLLWPQRQPAATGARWRWPPERCAGRRTA